MFYGYGFDPTFILILPAIILAAYAQSKVSSTFNKYLRIGIAMGIRDMRLPEGYWILTGFRMFPWSLYGEGFLIIMIQERECSDCPRMYTTVIPLLLLV